MLKYIGIFFSLILVLTSCQDQEQPQTELTVSAASSLIDVMKDLKGRFETDNPTIHLQFNFASSGILQRQIEQGAPVDLMISASEEEFMPLMKSNQINKQTHIDVVRNSIVLITPKKETNEIDRFEDLRKRPVQKIALGLPDTVPAGRYGKQVLTSLGLWGTIDSKLIFTKDVRQVLAYVESGNVDAGMVYQTDAQTSSKVQVVQEASEQTHHPIVYPAGMITGTPHEEEAQQFLEFIQTQEAHLVWKQHGFTPL